ncbi:MAG TPA: hypothetical protein ENK26_14705 [Gammaproteobacteria bacterium]|nr:hypothetical protein [Gammaproteobacteria bacterium]
MGRFVQQGIRGIVEPVADLARFQEASLQAAFKRFMGLLLLFVTLGLTSCGALVNLFQGG